AAFRLPRAAAARGAMARRASRWHRSAPGQCGALHSRCPTPARRQYNRRIVVPCLRGLYVIGVCVVLTGIQSHAQSDPTTQSDRAAARIRALQAESDKLAAQARTVFGELRRLEIEREIKQAEMAKTQTALARVTADRDRVEKRLKVLEATRVAQTPGIKERLVELSKRGRAGYAQLLLASGDVRAI